MNLPKPAPKRVLLLDTGNEWGGGTNSMFELLKRIDTAILDMKKDGTLDKFSKLYFPFAIYPIN